MLTAGSLNTQLWCISATH